MKKQLLFSTVTLLGLSLFSTAALAAPGDPVVEEPTESRDSVVGIQFTDNPNESGDTFKNVLSFAWQPKAFDFGEQTVEGRNAEYDLKSTHAGRQYVVVNDARSKENTRYGKSWAVTAAMSNLVQYDPADPETPLTNPLVLDNAELVLTFDKVQDYTIGDEVNPLKPSEIKPADPNGMAMVGDKQVPAVQDFAAGSEPQDIRLLTGTPELDGSEVTTIKGDNSEVKVLSQFKDRLATDQDTKTNQGYATNIKNAKIKFATLSSDVADKSFKGKVVWTLSRDIVSE